MITDFVLKLLFVVISFLLRPLQGYPDATLNSSIATSITAAAGYFNLIAAIFPMNTIYIVIGLMFATELVIFVVKSIIFGIKKIPFIG